MIRRSFLVTLLSTIIFFCVLVIFRAFISGKQVTETYFFIALFCGTVALIPCTFVLLCFLNYVVDWKIKASRSIKPDLVYFLYAVAFSVVPVFGFVLFEYSERVKDREEETIFANISEETVALLLFAVCVVVLNRKIMWNGFKSI